MKARYSRPGRVEPPAAVQTKNSNDPRTHDRDLSVPTPRKGDRTPSLFAKLSQLAGFVAPLPFATSSQTISKWHLARSVWLKKAQMASLKRSRGPARRAKPPLLQRKINQRKGRERSSSMYLVFRPLPLSICPHSPFDEDVLSLAGHGCCIHLPTIDEQIRCRKVSQWQ